MKCSNCNFEVSAKMTHAIDQNICPGCGNNIIPQEKLAQIKELKRVLSLNKITSDESFDAKIIDRVSTIIADHFDLKQASAVNDPDTIVEIPQSTEAQVSQPVQQTEQTSSSEGQQVSSPPTQQTEQVAQQDGPALDRDIIFEETKKQIEEEGVKDLMKDWYPPEEIDAVMKTAGKGATARKYDQIQSTSSGKNKIIRRVD